MALRFRVDESGSTRKTRVVIWECGGRVLVWTYGGGGAGGIRKKRSAPRVMDAGEFARVRLGIEPDETQMEVLQSGAQRVILNCSRQWGKSTVAALLATE